MVIGGWKHAILGSILKDFVLAQSGFEWMLGIQFWAESLLFLG